MLVILEENYTSAFTLRIPTKIRTIQRIWTSMSIEEEKELLRETTVVAFLRAAFIHLVSTEAVIMEGRSSLPR